ncbi:unnamed protein product, partial [Didymodactylos carnosus]
FAKSNIAVLVVQAVTAATTFSNLSESLSTKLEQALDDVNETMTLSEQQVEEVINPTTSTTSTTSSTTTTTTSTTAPPIRNLNAVIASWTTSVTWAAQLSTTTTDQVLIPALYNNGITTLPWLPAEVRYRRMTFCSSNHPTVARRLQVTITYVTDTGLQ